MQRIRIYALFIWREYLVAMTDTLTPESRRRTKEINFTWRKNKQTNKTSHKENNFSLMELHFCVIELITD